MFDVLPSVSSVGNRMTAAVEPGNGAPGRGLRKRNLKSGLWRFPCFSLVEYCSDMSPTEYFSGTPGDTSNKETT